MPIPVRQSVLPNAKTVASLLLLCAAIFLTYTPGPHVGHLNAADFDQLHRRRMQFARDHLLGPAHTLPAWYPRELLGTPFWSNVSNFPFIPTRLILLLLDPDAWDVCLIAAQLDAVLAALCAFLFCRRIGLGCVAAAVGGWTFACGGFFASRMLAGQMAVLDAYCGLPLLLWLVEALIQTREQRAARRWRLALGVASIGLLLAGHPQLPIYAFAIALFYAGWRGGWRCAIQVLAINLFAAGCAAFALLPMALLVLRSTRVLTLDHSTNDIALPARRLLGFLFPWIDGAPAPLAGSIGLHDVSKPVFWDTFVYCGWLPWIAAAALLALRLLGRDDRRLRGVVGFFALVGGAALLLSLQVVQHWAAALPGTLLRSPARLTYLTEFSLALLSATAIGALLDGCFGRPVRLLAGLFLAAHVWDVARMTRSFLVFAPLDDLRGSALIASVIHDAGDARVGFDLTVPNHLNRSADDVGFYDSIQLARTYRWLLDVDGASETLNTESLDAGQLKRRALAAAGVKTVLTYRDRPTLPLLQNVEGLRIFDVPSPQARARFYTDDQVRYLSADAIHARLRDPAEDLDSTLMLVGNATSAAPATRPSGESSATYRRISPDVIECVVHATGPGVLRLIESADAGWRVTVDSQPAPVLSAADALLAVQVPQGDHLARFEYLTPGATLGRWISLVSVGVMLLGLLRGLRQQRA